VHFEAMLASVGKLAGHLAMNYQNQTVQPASSAPVPSIWMR
jgi:hypothetical protein